jgi:hypothetical protein
LLLSPTLVARLLLGASLEAPAALIVGRVAAAVLAGAGASMGLAGVLMWPAVGLRAALVAWCITCLRSDLTTRPPSESGRAL